MVLCTTCQKNEATWIGSGDLALICQQCIPKNKEMTNVFIPYQISGSQAPNFDEARKLMKSIETNHKDIME